MNHTPKGQYGRTCSEVLPLFFPSRIYVVASLDDEENIYFCTYKKQPHRMNKILSLICCLCVCAASALAGGKNVKIKVVTPGTLTELLKGYADNDIKDLSVTGTLNANDVQSLQRFAGRNNSEKKHEGGLLEVLNLGKTTLTDMESGLNLTAVIAGSTTLRKVMLGNVFYVSAHTFSALPNLESVDFVGNVGHIDGFVFNNLPKLSRITFHQCVLSTGGAQFVKNCPVLTSVVFKGPVINTYYGQPIECPQLKGYTLKAPVLQSNFAAFFPQTTDAKALKACNWKGCMAYVETWGKLCLTGTSDFFADSPGTIVNLLFDMAKKTGNAPMAQQLEAVSKKFQEAAAARPKKETKLEILKQSAPYKRTGQTTPAFTYASPNDSLLTRTRDFFHLDEVAGTGDDLSRIKRLLYWLHDLVRHDGSSSWPKCRYNCVDLYQLCQTEKRGLNCRFMAEMLCEALLAENIPARYITCQSREYDTDNDCHVITIAWSRQLNKWVWVDPTFCAYVTDENGLWLHPGEVRERLQTGKKLILNEDANWNHESKQTVEGYLEEYMAKNLYILASNLHSRSEAESPDRTRKSESITLVPEGFKYKWGQTTSDDEYFWQAPPKELVE